MSSSSSNNPFGPEAPKSPARKNPAKSTITKTKRSSASPSPLVAARSSPAVTPVKKPNPRAERNSRDHDSIRNRNPAPFYTDDLQKAVATIGGNQDALDKESFNTVDYINELFPDKESLGELDMTTMKLKRKIQFLDVGIAKNIREQVQSNSRQQQDRAKAKEAITELFSKIGDIKRKAEQSENMVQEICYDIKKLDHAKRNLTNTINTLKKLQMLVTSVKNLEQMINAKGEGGGVQKQYREIAYLLEATNELLMTFKDYHHIPRIREVKTYLREIKATLQIQVYDVFQDHCSRSSSANSELSLRPAEKTGTRTLEDVCFIVDALGIRMKRDFMIWFCDQELRDYKDSFRPASDNARLESVEKRYTWLGVALRAYNEVWKCIFPASWRMSEMILEEFCCYTREALTKELEQRHSVGNLNVKVLLSALQKTIEFERDMQKKFLREAVSFTRMPSYEIEDLDDPDMKKTDASTIELGLGKENMKRRFHARVARNQLQYLKKMKAEKEEKAASSSSSSSSAKKSALLEGEQEESYEYDEELAVQADLAIEKFQCLLSSCFNPYMSIYVKEVNKLMQTKFDGIMEAETWDIGENERNKVLSSSQALMLYFKKTMDNLTEFTRNQAFFDLYKIFKIFLKQYGEALARKISTFAKGGKAPQDTAGKDMAKMIILIVNTADYCSGVTTQLTTTIKNRIEEAFQAGIDMTQEKKYFDEIAANGTTALVSDTMSALAPSLAKMRSQDWENWEEVEDQSPFVPMLEKVFTTKMPLIREWLVPVHFRFFCDSFASALLPKLQHAIYSSGKISSVGAQQMLLDVCYVKKLLTQVPTGTNAPPTGHAAKRYLKFVSSEAEKVEMLLKTLLSPYTPGSTSFVDTYNSLVADRSEANFVKVLDIKGIKKMDQALLLDAFRSRNVDTGPKVEIGTDDDTLSLSKIGSKFFQEGGDGASSTTFSRFFS